MTYTISIVEKFRNEKKDYVAGVAVIVINVRDKLKLIGHTRFQNITLLWMTSA